MHRLRVDFQKPGRNDVVWLTTMAAVYDLARIPDPRDGLQVVVYEPDGFAMHATLVREIDGLWSAALHPGTEIDCAIGTPEELRGYNDAVREVIGANLVPYGQPRFMVGQSLRIADAAFINWFALLDPWQPPLGAMIGAAGLDMQLANAGRSVVVAEAPPPRKADMTSPGDLRYRLEGLAGTWPEELLRVLD